jgi:hypothetical protein|tara:strand:- start:13711 stop:14775 length:1065 start_codon:yes stop_codon:yes gene_type:complete
MIYFLTASKDASVYLQQPDQNAGLDEILEVSKVFYGNIKDISRALLKFDIEPLSASIASGEVTMSSAELILREDSSEELPLNFTLEAYPISQSWEMGKGTRFDDITTAGVTWNNREGDSVLRWLQTAEFSEVSTGSYAGLGGTFYSNVFATQDFEYRTTDVNMDIKDIMEDWISGSIPNDGLILKLPFENEYDTSDYGILKFFSKETKTIHQPKIRIGWDDTTFATGSMTELVAEEIKVGLRNFKKEYKVNTTPKIRVVGRELYPIKTFSSTAQYSTSQFLNEQTYYQISDYHSGDVIVPFSDYTKVSCDTDGNFFKLNLTNWEVDRVYKIEIKVIIDGTPQFFDEDYTFGVIA